VARSLAAQDGAIPAVAGRLEPDPERGVFETLLIVDGTPIELDAHLERIAFAVHALFGAELPPELPDLARAHSAGHELGRLRMAVSRDEERRLGLEFDAAAVGPELVLPSWERAVDLVAIAITGGLGPFKWTDRRLLDRATAGLGPGALPLAVDERGAVLEASRANVFALSGEALATPPLDGRILPGIARARAIEAALAAGVEVRETELAVGDLIEAGEVFLTGSVRGIEPACSLDGAPLRPPGKVAGLLARALGERWLDRPALPRPGRRPAHRSR
jgi:para-aminobenzoate synthetase / 4-amino-4-deoxychorismate lyase